MPSRVQSRGALEAIVAAIDKKELSAMEPGAMCYMLSKQGYSSDRDGHWHPHLMFFYSPNRPWCMGSGSAGFSGYRVFVTLGSI